MAGGCWSSAQPDLADLETAGLLLSGLPLKKCLTWLNMSGLLYTPVSTALDIIEPRKLLHHNKVQSKLKLPLCK